MPKPLSAVLFFALSLLSCDLGRPPARIAGPGQRLADIYQEGYTQALEDFDLPGISLSVIDTAEVIWLECFGVSNLETGQSNNPDRLHRLGQVSMTFVSFALHKLENEGVLSLNDTLASFFPETGSSYLETITLRQILSHSSGIVSAGLTPLEEDPLFYRGALDFALDTEPIFPAGERFSYSFTGYDILGLVIEKVTGEDFAPYMDTQILPELGMSGASFSSEGKTIVPGHVEGRTFEEKGFSVPSGGMVATLNQLSDFVIKLSDIYYSASVTPWDREDIDSIRGYHNGQNLWPSGVYFGLGSAINLHRFASSGPVLGMEGYTYGSSAGFYYLPEDDVGIAFLSNNLQVPAGLLSSQILKSLFDTKNLRRIRKYEPPVTQREPLTQPLTLAEAGGRYYGENSILDVQDGNPIAQLIRIGEDGEILRNEVEVTDRELGFFWLEGDFSPELSLLEAKIYGLQGVKRIYNKFDGTDEYSLLASTQPEAVPANPGWAGIYTLAEGPKKSDEWSEDMMVWIQRDDLILEVVDEGLFLYYESDHFIKGIKRSGYALEGNRIVQSPTSNSGVGDPYQMTLEDGVWTMDYRGAKYQKVTAP